MSDTFLICGRRDGVLGDKFDFQEPNFVSDECLYNYYETLVRWKDQGYVPTYKPGVYYVLSLIAKRFPGRKESLIEVALHFTKTSKDLFLFNSIMDQCNVGWNRTRRSICKAWYEDCKKPVHMLEKSWKYSHKDVIQLCHVDPNRDSEDTWKSQMYRALLGMPYDHWELPSEVLVGLRSDISSTRAIVDSINNGLPYRVLDTVARWMPIVISSALRNFDTDCFREVKMIEISEEDLLFMEQNIRAFAKVMNPLQCLVISRNARSERMKDILERISLLHDQGALSFRLEIGTSDETEIKVITNVLSRFGKISDDGEISVLVGTSKDTFDIVFAKNVVTKGTSLTLGFRPSNYAVFESFLSAIM